jgi:hypothetical protein
MKNFSVSRKIKPEQKIGKGGVRTSPSVNGRRFAKTIRTVEIPGPIFLMTMPEVAFTAGEKTDCWVSLIANAGSALLWRSGMAATQF